MCIKYKIWIFKNFTIFFIVVLLLLFLLLFLLPKIETFQAKKKAAALREKDQVYDEIGGEVSSRTEDYFSDNYQYSDGQSSYRSYVNGVHMHLFLY